MRQRMLEEPRPQVPPHLRPPAPTIRPLQVYAFDPSRGRRLGNQMTLQVTCEPLRPGPCGERVAVVDYDGAQRCFYHPVDLEDPHVLMRGGLDPSESNPFFHQQMVYAVAMDTLQQFEAALGRRIHWRRWERDAKHQQAARGQPRTLKLYPHAMAEQNAFYSPAAEGILFGYFRAGDAAPGRNLPGQAVFTCLSHDIIAHEVTHAIVDGIKEYFMEPTNLDVLAFHEAFADLVALFRHFSHRAVLLDSIQKTGGRLFDAHLRPAAAVAGGAASKAPVLEDELGEDNPLIELARQFGEASGRSAALRSALGTPASPHDYETATEPHTRGAVLVSAVFAAYFTVYLRRSTNVFRLYRTQGGEPGRDDLPSSMAELLAAEAARTADQFFRLCVRSLDYCPPVDLTFGDFLRAVITVHTDLQPVDDDGVRDALMQAFRLRGIYPAGAAFFSEDALCWPRILKEDLPPLEGLAFGDPGGLTRDEQNRNGAVLGAYARKTARALGFEPGLRIQPKHFHPTFRVGLDGRLRTDMVVELVQHREVAADPLAPDPGTFPLRGGVTLLVSKPVPDEDGDEEGAHVRYVIPKHLRGDEGRLREDRQRAFYLRNGYLARARGPGGRIQIDFALMHRGL